LRVFAGAKSSDWNGSRFRIVLSNVFGLGVELRTDCLLKLVLALRKTGKSSAVVSPEVRVCNKMLEALVFQITVAKIAEELLFELGRPNGATVKLTLEIDASSPAGYSKDIVDVVRSNVRDLKLDTGEVGFEDE